MVVVSHSDLSQSNLCKQINEGLTETLTETEIIRTVLKMTKPGTFKHMSVARDSLTVAELKRFLLAHLRDKSSTKLFHEHDKESPQQFMYRLMGLKQCVMFASKQSTGFKHDSKLVQGVFFHSLYQGMNEKCSYIGRDLKPHTSNLRVTNDFILELITRVVSKDAERQHRLGQTHKQKVVNVNATAGQQQAECCSDTSRSPS